MRTIETKIQLPKKLEKVLTTTKRIVVVYGGRGSAKSETIGRVLIIKSDMEGADVLCGREFQTSIEDSVHKLLKELVEGMEYIDAIVTDKKIDFVGGGGFRYKGFSRNSSAVRSASRYKYSWIEEAQTLSTESIQDLLPTIREEDSQLFFSANLMSSADAFSQRFIEPFKKELDRDGFYEDEMHLIIKMNYQDNPWFPKELEMQRQWDFKHLSRAEYDHIWDGAYNDTVSNSIIEAEWFDAAIDAHKTLGFEPKGFKIVSHDPSDSKDPRGLAYRHGSVLLDVQEKTDGDVNDGCDWATSYAIQVGADMFSWDCDGLGISLKRQVVDALHGKKIEVQMFKGSESPVMPHEIYQPDERLEMAQARTNEQTFRNKRAQYCIRLRDRFYNAYRAVVKGEYVDPEHLISISSNIKCIDQLRSETCRIPRKLNANGFIQIMTKEEMLKMHKIQSPNLFDSAMMTQEIPAIKRIINKPINIPRRSFPGQRR